MVSPDPASRRDVRPRVIHVTTAHRADDMRIFERECRSLASTGRYDVFLAAAGRIPDDVGVTLNPWFLPRPVGPGGLPRACGRRCGLA